MAPLRDSVALFLRRRRSTLCLLLSAIVLLGLTESARGAPGKVRQTFRYKRVYTAEALLIFGPQYFHRTDSIQVYGLVHGGSKINLNCLLKKEGALMVEIEIEGREKTYRFPAAKESYYEKETLITEPIPLLAELGDEPRVAIFTFWLEDRSGRQDASFELKYLGIEGKPDAVASMDSGTRLAMLAPGDLQFDSTIPIEEFISDIAVSHYGDGMLYSFALSDDLDRLEVEVFNDGGRRFVKSLDTRCSPSKDTPCKEAWDGLGNDSKKSTGLHLVLVRAWASKDWGVKFSPLIPIPRSL